MGKTRENKPGIRPRRGSRELPKAFRDPATGQMVSTVEPMENSPLAQQDRLTMSVSISHERFKEQPFGIRRVFQEMLEHKLDDPYADRRQTFGEQWEPVNLWWMSEVAGTIVIENLTGKGMASYPTEEERIETAKKVIELSYSQNSKEADELKPGRIYFKTPTEGSVLYGRSRSGKVLCKITVFSR